MAQPTSVRELIDAKDTIEWKNLSAGDKEKVKKNILKTRIEPKLAADYGGEVPDGVSQRYKSKLDKLAPSTDEPIGDKLSRSGRVFGHQALEDAPAVLDIAGNIASQAGTKVAEKVTGKKLKAPVVKIGPALSKMIPATDEEIAASPVSAGAGSIAGFVAPGLIPVVGPKIALGSKIAKGAKGASLLKKNVETAKTILDPRRIPADFKKGAGRAIVENVGQGVTVGTAYNANKQLQKTGEVNPKEAAESGAFGGALGLAIPGAIQIAKAGGRRLKGSKLVEALKDKDEVIRKDVTEVKDALTTIPTKDEVPVQVQNETAPKPVNDTTKEYKDPAITSSTKEQIKTEKGLEVDSDMKFKHTASTSSQEEAYETLLDKPMAEGQATYREALKSSNYSDEAKTQMTKELQAKAKAQATQHKAEQMKQYGADTLPAPLKGKVSRILDKRDYWVNVANKQNKKRGKIASDVAEKIKTLEADIEKVKRGEPVEHGSVGIEKLKRKATQSLEKERIAATTEVNRLKTLAKTASEEVKQVVNAQLKGAEQKLIEVGEKTVDDVTASVEPLENALDLNRLKTVETKIDQGGIHSVPLIDYLDLIKYQAEKEGFDVNAALQKAKEYHKGAVEEKYAKGKMLLQEGRSVISKTAKKGNKLVKGKELLEAKKKTEVSDEVLESYPELYEDATVQKMKETRDIPQAKGKLKASKKQSPKQEEARLQEQANELNKSITKLETEAEAEITKNQKLVDKDKPAKSPNKTPLPASKKLKAAIKGKIDKAVDALESYESIPGPLMISLPQGLVRNIPEAVKRSVYETLNVFHELRRPVSYLAKETKGKYDDLTKALKINENEGLAYIGKIYRPALLRLQKLGGLVQEEADKLIPLLDDETLTADQIINKTVDKSHPVWSQLDEDLREKASAIADFFKRSGEAGGVPPEKMLKNYIPHWRTFDDDGFYSYFLPEELNQAKPGFQRKRGDGSTIQSTDLLAMMDGYANGVKRHLMRKSTGDVNKAIREILTKGEENFTRSDINELISLEQVRENLLKIYRPGRIDKWRVNAIHNALKMNPTSSLSNLTQGPQLIMADVGVETYMQSVDTLIKSWKDPELQSIIRPMLQEMGVGTNLIAKFGELDDVVKTNPEEAERIIFDMFSNIEAEINQPTAAIAGMIRRLGAGPEGAKKLVATLQDFAKNSANLNSTQKALYEDLMMAARDQNQRTNMVPYQVDRRAIESSQMGKFLLTFLNYTVGEMSLVTDWGIQAAMAAGRKDVKGVGENLQRLSLYMLVKAALTGKNAATLLLPKGVADGFASIYPNAYTTLSDWTDNLDEANLLKKATGGMLDFSDTLGGIDLTQPDSYKSPLAEMSLENLVKLVTYFGTGQIANDLQGANLSEEELAMPKEERDKLILKRVADKSLMPAFGLGAGFVKPLSINVGPFKVEVGTNLIKKILKSSTEAYAGKSSVMGQDLESNLLKAASRIVGPSTEDVDRFRRPARFKTGKILLNAGAEKLPKDVTEGLTRAKGFKPEELEGKSYDALAKKDATFGSLKKEYQTGLTRKLRMALADKDRDKVREVYKELQTRLGLSKEEIKKLLKSQTHKPRKSTVEKRGLKVGKLIGV